MALFGVLFSLTFSSVPKGIIYKADWENCAPRRRKWEYCLI